MIQSRSMQATITCKNPKRPGARLSERDAHFRPVGGNQVRIDHQQGMMTISFSHAQSHIQTTDAISHNYRVFLIRVSSALELSPRQLKATMNASDCVSCPQAQKYMVKYVMRRCASACRSRKSRAVTFARTRTFLDGRSDEYATSTQCAPLHERTKKQSGEFSLFPTLRDVRVESQARSISECTRRCRCLVDALAMPASRQTRITTADGLMDGSTRTFLILSDLILNPCLHRPYR